MAHGKRGQRDGIPSSLTEPDMLLSEPLVPFPDLDPFEDANRLNEVQDSRQFTPEGLPSPSDLSGRVAEVGFVGEFQKYVDHVREFMELPEKVASIPSRTVGKYRPDRLVFRRQYEAIECVRRKVRREVMFAFRKTRKGAGAKRERDEWSNVKC